MRGVSSVKHKLFVFLSVFVLLFVFCVSSFSASFNLSVYSDLSSSSSQASNLFGIYKNSDYYSPFKCYRIFRSGQYEYFLVASNDFDDNYYYCRYYSSGTGSSSSYKYSQGYVSEALVYSNTSDYSVVGNESGSIDLSSASSSSSSYVLVILVVCILVLLIFKIFRFKRPSTVNSMRL